MAYEMLDHRVTPLTREPRTRPTSACAVVEEVLELYNT